MPKQQKYPTRPKKREEVYAEWDEEFALYGVFGLTSGFCYSQHFDKIEAEQKVIEHNKRLETQNV